MKIGTKSVLFGAHCFFLHPWFVAAAWWKLYGFPWDPRLWVAFFVHDIGYLGKPNMDGPEGERHVEVGARIMSFLFDGRPRNGGRPINGAPQDLSKWLVLADGSWIGPWGQSFPLVQPTKVATLFIAENGSGVLCDAALDAASTLQCTFADCIRKMFFHAEHSHVGMHRAG